METRNKLVIELHDIYLSNSCGDDPNNTKYNLLQFAHKCNNSV